MLQLKAHKSSVTAKLFSRERWKKGDDRCRK